MATIDLTTLTAVKAQIETSVATADAVISTLITEASRAIMEHTGRRIAPLDGAASDRHFEADDAYDAIRRELWVWDLSALPVAVEILDAADANVATLTVGTDLMLIPRNRESWQPVERLRLRPSATAPGTGQSVRVNGIWGWPSVPEHVAHACIITVRAWLRKDSSGFAEVADFGRQVSATPPGGWMLPMAAKQLLAPVRRLGVV